MALSFNNLVTLIDETVGTNSTSFTTANKTLYINLAVSNLMLMLHGEGAGGVWVLDDSNQSDLPEVYEDLVSGTRTYSFTEDPVGNNIIDIRAVFAKDSSSGVYQLLTPVGIDDAPSTMDDGQATGGVPTHYRKSGKRVSLDLIPDYNSTDGLKALVSRESTYFISTDTTNEWGFPGLWHEYLVLYPSYKYAKNKNLPIAESLKRDVQEMEAKISKHSGLRSFKDGKPRVTVKFEETK